MIGIQGLIACIASIPQVPEPCPSWKTMTTIPNAAASETRLRITALSGSTSDRNAREQDVGQRQHEGKQVGEVAVDGVDEVAIDGRSPADGRVRPFQRSLG